MKFFIDEVEVFFPYSYIYPEQYNYMVKLKQVLDAKGPGVLEMPSGTGKTVTLLSLITSYQIAHPEVGKLVYCSRTVPELEKVLEEAKVVKAYRDKELAAKAPSPSLWLGLSSRRNLCIHPRVSEEKDNSHVDAKCRNMTASFVRERAKTESDIELCQFYEGFESFGKDIHLNGVYTLEDLRNFGNARTICPYFLARHSVQLADVLVFSYQYVIDPKISEIVTKDVKNCILVFDEAHNIDNVCIDALSININRNILEASQRNITRLQSQIAEVRRVDAERLRREYLRLVDGLAQQNVARGIADQLRADPALSDDTVQEVVPGNIRRGEHFLTLLKRFVEYIKTRMRTSQVVSESPLSFLQKLLKVTQIDSKTLRFCSSRLGSLMFTLELTDIDQFYPLSVICDFATLLGTYSQGFLLIIEPTDDRSNLTGDSLLQFCCLDASLAMQPVIRKYRSVVITSGTISPLDIYPRMLNFKPVAVEKFPMSLTRNCVCPLVVSRGSDQVVISSKFDLRNDPAVVRNFGNLLVEMSAIVPDGIVCFFTSYYYMEEIVSFWNEMGLLNNVLANKLLFVETPDPAETALALENYKKACNSGRGAVLFSVARGKVSEGIDFSNQYGRCVILFGIPYVNTESRILKARLEFLRDNYQLKENEFLTFDAMRTASQCVGRVIRGKTDYGIMIFADKRYNRMDKRGKLPTWIGEFLTPGNLNLSTDMAVNASKRFLKEMAQPWTKDEQLGKSLWTLDHVLKHQQQSNKNT